MGGHFLVHKSQQYRGTRSMRSLGLRVTALIGLTLLVAACDKCGDPVQFHAPSLPHSCYESQPAQK
jgi:hypothetical protein